jgi:hypothetical protein
MEAMLGLAMLSVQLSLSQANKNAMSFLLSLLSSIQKNWRREQNRFCLEVRGVGGKGRRRGQGEEMAQTMYAHMNK